MHLVPFRVLPYAFGALAFFAAVISSLAQDQQFPVAAGSGLTAEDAARLMTLPDGFRSTPFASEPVVHQPIAFMIDERGRLWVVENYSYPDWSPYGRDRIVILEDTDGDGRSDKRTVFFEGLNFASAIAVGQGGAWVGSAPYLLFIPDRNRDDTPDGPPQVILDGWGWQDTHEMLGWHGCSRRRARARGNVDLSRRHVSSRVSRHALHAQYPGQPHQSRSAKAHGLRLHRQPCS